LRPGVIEERTGLVGDFGAEKGHLHVSSSGRTVTQRTGVWSVTTEQRVESTSIERHLVFLLEQLEPVGSELLALAEEQGLAADFFCYWVSADGDGGPIVSPTTLKRIGAMRATLGFDFYGPFLEAEGRDRLDVGDFLDHAQQK
jgi:hypothetical protein